MVALTSSGQSHLWKVYVMLFGGKIGGVFLFFFQMLLKKTLCQIYLKKWEREIIKASKWNLI